MARDKFICKKCESYFTALFGDSYCTNEKSSHYMGYDMKVLDFDLTKPPIKTEVKNCKYFKTGKWGE